MSLTIYHNPRCSKSRQALELMRGRGRRAGSGRVPEDPAGRAPPWTRILDLLGHRAPGADAPQGARVQAGGSGQPALTREQLIDAMLAHPKLIERPIVIKDGKRATLGRPPEQVLDVL